jgi:hypothetical protein
MKLITTGTPPAMKKKQTISEQMKAMICHSCSLGKWVDKSSFRLFGMLLKKVTTGSQMKLKRIVFPALQSEIIFAGRDGYQ